MNEMTQFGYAIVTYNRPMLGDSYKYTHPKLYPANADNMYDYAEARSLKIYDKTFPFPEFRPNLNLL